MILECHDGFDAKALTVENNGEMRTNGPISVRVVQFAQYIDLPEYIYIYYYSYTKYVYQNGLNATEYRHFSIIQILKIKN